MMNTSQNSKSKNGCSASGILMLLAVAAFFTPFLLNGARAARLLEEHETIEADVVVSGILVQSSRYEFTINGRSFKGRGGTEKAGDKVEVAYRKDDPITNRPADGLVKDIVIAGGILIVAVVSWIVFFTDPVSTPVKPEGKADTNTDEGRNDDL